MTVSIKTFWGNIWNSLTKPSPSITTEEKRYQARFIAGLMLVSWGIVTLYVLLSEFALGVLEQEAAQVYSILLSWVVFGILYGVSRSPYYLVSAVVFIFAIVLLVFGILSSAEDSSRMSMLFFLAVPVLAVGGLFSYRSMVITAAACMVGAALYSSLGINLDGIEDVTHWVINSSVVIIVAVLFMGYRIDLEQRRQNQLTQVNRSIAESEQRTRLLLDNVPSVIAYILPNGIIEYSNRPDTLAPGQSLYTTLQWVENRKLADGIQRVLETALPVKCELSVSEPLGKIIWYTVQISPLVQNGTISSLILVMTDISQRIESEQIQRARQEEMIRELSAPIIPLVEGVIAIPLIGSIDSSRAKEITRSLLAGISQYDAHTVIIDITGVPLVDTAIASHFYRTIKVAQLKGTKTIVTGISNDVAETLVNIGIDWSAIDTRRDLQAGIAESLQGITLTTQKHSSR